LNRAVSRVATLQSQDALILLRYSLSIPKLHTLRTSDFQSNPALIEFDNSLRNCLSTILNVELYDDQWSQASLLVRDGDLEFVVLSCWHHQHLGFGCGHVGSPGPYSSSTSIHYPRLICPDVTQCLADVVSVRCSHRRCCTYTT